MVDLFQSGYVLIAVNTALAVGLVVCGRTLRTPVGGSTRNFTSSQLVVGGICLVLAGLDLAVALGPGRQSPILSNLTAIPPVDFYILALCYAICGGALLLGRGGHHGQTSSLKAPGAGEVVKAIHVLIYGAAASVRDRRLSHLKTLALAAVVIAGAR